VPHLKYASQRIPICGRICIFSASQSSVAMLPIVIVLLLLTALVATEPSSPNDNGGDN
jgi:hypothetical protein